MEYEPYIDPDDSDIEKDLNVPYRGGKIVELIDHGGKTPHPKREDNSLFTDSESEELTADMKKARKIYAEMQAAKMVSNSSDEGEDAVEKPKKLDSDSEFHTDDELTETWNWLN